MSRKNGLTDKQDLFLEWLITPRPRVPPTEAEWGRVNQVHQRTSRRWKADSEFRAAWDRRLHDLQVDPDRVDEVLEALHLRASAGDVQAAKLWLEVADRYRPKMDLTVTDDRSLTDVSDAELQGMLAAAAADELEARQG